MDEKIFICRNCGAYIDPEDVESGLVYCKNCGKVYHDLDECMIPVVQKDTFPVRAGRFLRKNGVVIGLAIAAAVCAVVLFMWVARIDRDNQKMKLISEGKISLGCSESYEGQYYESVVDQLNLMGFYNIQVVNLDKFCFFPFNKKKVEGVYVNGISDFDEDFLVDKDTQIIIRYY